MTRCSGERKDTNKSKSKLITEIRWADCLTLLALLRHPHNFYYYFLMLFFYQTQIRRVVNFGYWKNNHYRGHLMTTKINLALIQFCHVTDAINTNPTLNGSEWVLSCWHLWPILVPSTSTSGPDSSQTTGEVQNTGELQVKFSQKNMEGFPWNSGCMLCWLAMVL